MVVHDRFILITKDYNTMIKITDQVKEIVEKSGIENGIAYIIIAHTTAGITVNEGLECLESDIQDLLNGLVPEDAPYAHGRFLHTYGAMAGNPTGHLKTHLTGNHAVFPVVEHKIVLGSAQDIYLCEFDGPQDREIMVTVMGD